MIHTLPQADYPTKSLPLKETYQYYGGQLWFDLLIPTPDIPSNNETQSTETNQAVKISTESLGDQ